MRLNIVRPDGTKSTVDGANARQHLRKMLTSITSDMLLPVAPFTGKVRRQVVEALRRGQPVYDKPTDLGRPSSKSVILTMPPKIVGIINEKGEWIGDGPDPRLGTDGVDGNSKSSAAG